jgi:hypothetical protein
MIVLPITAHHRIAIAIIHPIVQVATIPAVRAVMTQVAVVAIPAEAMTNMATEIKRSTYFPDQIYTGKSLTIDKTIGLMFKGHKLLTPMPPR